MDVLLIDDSLEVASSVRLILQQAGHHVDVAFDGPEGVERACSHRYDLFLVDFRMPRTTGFEFLMRVRRSKRLEETPVVFIGARPSPADRARALDMGALDIIPKPFDPRELVTRLERALDRAGKPTGQEPITRSLDQSMAGRIGEMLPVDLIQLFHLGRKDGTLAARTGKTKLKIYFRKGNACAAKIVQDGFTVVRGEDAFFKFLEWPEGEFAIDFSPPAETAGIRRPTEQLLIEAARRLDEATR